MRLVGVRAKGSCRWAQNGTGASRCSWHYRHAAAQPLAPLLHALLRCADLEGGLREEHTHLLQRLLLEAVANGSVSSGPDVERLLRCTLAFHQCPYHIVHAATRAALAALRFVRSCAWPGVGCVLG